MSDKGSIRSLLMAVTVFSLAFLIGFFAVRDNPDIGTTLMSFFNDTVASSMVEKPPFQMAGILFMNNLGACLLLFIGGAAFGSITFLILAVNGVVIGAVLETARSLKGFSFVVAAVLPHGLLEIPSFIIAGTLGFALAQAMVRELAVGSDAAGTARQLAKTFFVLVIPLIACAALVEAFITPEVIRLVVSP